jgi:HTH-type transcriptional regulator/antitoxin HigA
MAERQVAEVFPPGELIKEEIEARGWTQIDLAEIIGKSARLVNEVIAGKRAVTPDTARALADAFGTSAQFWMNLESSYQLSKLKTDASPVARRAKLFSFFPVKEMIRRGWIPASENLDVMEAQFCNFFGLGKLHRNFIPMRQGVPPTPKRNSRPCSRRGYIAPGKLPKVSASANILPSHLMPLLLNSKH